MVMLFGQTPCYTFTYRTQDDAWAFDHKHECSNSKILFVPHFNFTIATKVTSLLFFLNIMARQRIGDDAKMHMVGL
jgi:hypothetical protein